MDKEEQKIKLHEKSIEELRRMHDEICELYRQIRIRVLTFLGGGFALLSYLYAGRSEDSDVIKNLFIPDQVYGTIFYFLGLGACLISISILFLTMQSVSWRMPTEMKVHKKLNALNYLEFLEYVRDEYVDALRINMSHCEAKQKKVSLATSLLIIGAVLLLVIKNFN